MTLVELLVVIAIIGALMGLLIPAIRAARGSGKEVSCKNNLRQTGLALEMHHGDRGSYPADSKNGYGIGAFILPYVEQQSLYRLLKPRSRQQPANVASPQLGGASVDAYLCPTMENHGRTLFELGRSTYLGTRNLFPWKLATTDVRDGKSNTVAMGETLIEQAWALPGTADAIRPGDDGTFGSRHPDGANFVFCDGSVHFISEDIDPEVFTTLCTIDGGESVVGWP